MWGPGTIPFTNKNGTISIVFDNVDPEAAYSILVYNYKDNDRFTNKETGEAVLCGDKNTIESKICTPDQIGKFLPQDNQTFASSVLNIRVTAEAAKAHDFKAVYSVDQSSVFCAVIESVPDKPFQASITYENPYGKLPGPDYPKLPFFGFLSITYLLIGAVWCIRAWMSWKDLLMLQHYVTAVIFFLMIEMAFNYGFFEDYNLWGSPNMGLLVMVVILNAGRNSISFFMLLIVALGYGVVRPTLGNLMQKCLILTGVHFVCGVMYGAGTLLMKEFNALEALIFVLPLSLSMTAFYAAILMSLTETMQTLELRRQSVKLTMYKRLWMILVISVCAIGLNFVINMIVFSKRRDPQWIPVLWKWRWLAMDGSLNILYLIVFVSIAYLWRPTDNNQRYGLDELASEDWEDEIEAAINGGGAMPSSFSHIKLRNVKGVRGTDSTVVDSGDEHDDHEHEHEEDLFRWAEENLEEQSGNVPAGVVGSRDENRGLMSNDDEDLSHQHKML
ncbi:hypothetical protein HDU76_000009 [Blyttiomyces sp. JEL0837]|nr:hypothetical protein HDU76_000009 [Blyttiomyces sp. JEL0837]